MIGNEQIKPAPTWINGLSIATFAAGGLAPIVSELYASKTGGSSAPVLVISFVCFAVAGARHYLARLVLKGMKPRRS